jgi:FkbM family methyltransferase
MIWTSPFSLRIRRLARHLGLNRIVGKWMQGSGYEDRFGAELLSAIKPGDVVWDVGANVGLYSDLFIAKTGPSGRVVAFEPAPECYAALMQRFADKPAFSAVNVALGATDGTVVMEMASVGLAPTHRIVATEEVGGTRARTIPVRSAQSICDSRPDWFPNVVKVDVEGHEGHVFDGFGDLLADKRLRSIGVEVHFGLLQGRGEDETPAKIDRQLRAAGFVARWTDPSHVVARRPT